MSGGGGIPRITDADVEQFLFDAPGYESGASKIRVPGLPDDEKIIQFSEDLFEMTDQYVVAPNGRSTGVTKIRYDGKIVHVSHYGGWYRPDMPEVLDFLKLALLQTKRTREFIGGRGPRCFPNKEGTLVYINIPEINNFSRFRGKEEIFQVLTGVSLGFHDYWGMSFLSRPH